MTLVERFLSSLHSLELEAGTALVAVSGGPDSRALLDLAYRTRDRHGLSLIVAHVDHGMHPDSARVAREVARVAETMTLDYVCSTVRLDAGASETEAREARLGALEAIRRRRDAAVVLLGHSGDDQVETVLMRALAGSGPAGLAAMQARNGTLVRPLLPFRRSELVQYLQAEGLEWWDDPANLDPRHLRSWVRRDLLPVIEARVPGVRENLLALAAQAGLARRGWDALLDVLPALEWRHEDHGGSVAAATLAGYDSSLGVAVLQAVSRRAGCPSLGVARAQRALDLVRRGQSGKTVELPGAWRVELAFGRLRFTLAGPSKRALGQAEVGRSRSGTRAWGDWSLSWRIEAAPARQRREATSAWFLPEALTVREWREGDRIFPLGGTGHRAVVRCLQEARVPLSRRRSWPVIEAAGRVVWIPGVCRSGDLVPPEGSEALRVDVADD
jgi:tRNA(Ile)-lysidine synthase